MNSSVVDLKMLQLNVQTNAQIFFSTYGKAIFLSLFAVAIMFLMISGAEASTATATGAGNEFNATADKFDKWIKGGLGKTAALLALGVGLVVAAVKKDWSWLGGGIAVAIVAGVAGSIIGASFTAVI